MFISYLLKSIKGDYIMKLRINESVYEIIYDYTSEEGYEENNNVEQFEGTWTDLQDYLKQMRRNGCYNISANEISDYESVKRADTSRLIESDDKITAKSFQELISKLEDHGYSCEHYYDTKYPESNWLYITKNGDPYEAEFYKYRDGEYELYLHNIHPTKREDESITRSKRNKLVEKSNFDTVEKAIRYYYPKWYYDDMSVNDIFDSLEKLGHSQDFIDAVIDGITAKYENEEDYELDDYDECLKTEDLCLEGRYGTLADYLENHLDSWYGRLNEIGEDIEELGLDVDEINGEYIIVHANEPDGEDVYCKITLGGTERTISLEKFEMV